MESFGIFVGFIILSVCAVVVGHALYLRIRKKKISRSLGIFSILASIPLSWVMVSALIVDSIDYNPTIRTSEQLIGHYSNGQRSISLNPDGTYVASGFDHVTSGRWRNYDWNLTLTDSPFEKPRIITRNGKWCIAPFYAGPDDTMGILLERN